MTTEAEKALAERKQLVALLKGIINGDTPVLFVHLRQAANAIEALADGFTALKAERDEARKLFDGCAYARDNSGFIGTVPECINFWMTQAEAAETALATAKARIAELEGANEKLAKQIRAASRWYWPEDDTSSDACRESVREVFEYEPPGTIGAYSCGGVVYTRYYGWLPPSDDADSDDEFEVDEPTREAAEAKMAEEVARRSALEPKP